MPDAAVARRRTVHYLRRARAILRSKLRGRVRWERPLRLRPWQPVSSGDVPERGAWCVLCDWRGERFEGGFHSESAACPRCQSVARDRFLYFCMFQRVPYRRDLRMLETSPRLGRGYRSAMARRVHYLASDYDERAHKADTKLDLTRMALPDASLDLVLTAHVLEHVPDTGAVLSELYRVLRPGGRMLIQVPLTQPVTAPPPEPERSEEHTSELQSRRDLVCRLLLEKKKKKTNNTKQKKKKKQKKQTTKPRPST